VGGRLREVDVVLGLLGLLSVVGLCASVVGFCGLIVLAGERLSGLT
jgi:hypothetical protein